MYPKPSESLHFTSLSFPSAYKMTDARKRTSSFSLPPPTKLQRTDSMTITASPLRRTESLFSILPDDSDESMESLQLPYYKTLQYHKDQRLKRQQSTALLGTHDPHCPRPSSSSAAAAAALYSSAQLTPPLKPKNKLKRVPTLTTLPISVNINTNGNPNAPPPKRSRPLPTPSLPLPVKHTQIFLPSARPLILTLRTSSPLSPHSHSHSHSFTTTPSNPYSSTSSPIPPLPPVPLVRTHPRSRPEPDLYRKAIKQRMRTTPEGRKVLNMGPRLAMSIVNATRELERIVAAGLIGGCGSGSGSSGGGGGGAGGDYWDDGDVLMGDSCSDSMGYAEKSGAVPPVLTNSWVIVRGDDWEMVDCAA